MRRPYWSFGFKKERGDAIDEELSRLLDLLWPRRREILALVERRTLTPSFSSSISIHENRPLYCLSPETLERLAHFRAEYCMDIFDYSE